MNVFAGTDSRTARCPSVASAGRWLLDRVATLEDIAELAGHSDASEGTDRASRPQTSTRTYATAPTDGWPGWR
jgi:hypothetical protein